MVESFQPVSLSPALIVDDDAAMRSRLHGVLRRLGCDDAQVVLADGFAQAQQALGQRGFSIALIDIGLPDGSGVELIGWMRARYPEVAPVVVSAWRTEQVIVAALRTGAIGYLLKERDDRELEAALRSIEQGGAPIDPFIARHILELLTRPPAAAAAPASRAKPKPQPKAEKHPPRHVPPPPPPPGSDTPTALSPRELRILELVAQGLSNREMAEHLSISKLTVECHTKNIYRKLAVGSRTEAVYQGRRHGLLR